MDTLIVGAGFAGAVCARELAEAGAAVTLLERRPHIGGNAHDRLDAAGVRIHPYGPHIFHTQSDKIYAWLSRFTDWLPYAHRVLSVPDVAVGTAYPMPINRTTINRLYGLDLSEAEVAAHLERVRVPRSPLATSEDVVLNSVGQDLCERFYAGYTRKQWGLPLSALSAGVAARIPTRCNDDDRYFTDRHQAMPAHGYSALFERLLDHPRIQVRTGTAFDPERDGRDAERTIYTGPIDAYYGHRYGRLPYRSLRFEHEHLPGVARWQAVGSVNYPNDHAWTRITEFKHLTGQQHSGTSIVREIPCDEGDPYYPIPTAANEALYQRYRALADAETRVHFVGRLAQYRYYNMDQVVAAALTLCATLRSDPPVPAAADLTAVAT